MAKKSDTISIKINREIFHEPFFATQYRVASDEHSVTIFLAHSVGGQTIVCYAVVLSASTAVDINKESVLTYFNRVRNLVPHVEPAAESSFGVMSPKVIYGTFMDFAHNGQLAQVRVNWVDGSKVAAIQKGSDTSKEAGRSICIFDCPLAVQLGIIKKVYIGV